MVDLVSLRLSAVGNGGLPHAARATAVLLQQGSALQADATGAEPGRLPCERASFDCRALTVAVFHKQHAATTEQALIEADEGREAAASVSAPLDHVCMRSRGHGRARRGGRARTRREGPRSGSSAKPYVPRSRRTMGGARRCIRSATGAGPRATPKASARASETTCWRYSSRSMLTVTVQCHGAHELLGQIAEHLGQ